MLSAASESQGNDTQYNTTCSYDPSTSCSEHTFEKVPNELIDFDWLQLIHKRLFLKVNMR